MATFHGEVNASGHTDERPDGAGIGTGRSGQGGSITIFDGKIYVQGGIGGAGIGSGGGSGGRPSITIHGGTITAKGGMSGAGIGDGAETQSISNAIRITGGTIQATGGGGTYGTSAQIGNLKLSAGAGIGTGGNAMGSAKFTISGGEVYAHGGGLYESSQRDGAGIGGGYACPGCKVTISGGKVTAVFGLDGSSAIGAGDEPIGASSGSLDDGTLSLPANYSVKAGNNSSSLSLSSATSRQSKCWREFYAIIEPCMHSQAHVSIVDAHYHMPTRSCGYCEVTADTHEPHVFGDYGECAACGIISLNDDASNADIISHWAGKEKTVVLTGRTLYKDNAWNTLCLPFSTSTMEDDLDGATVKTLESSSFSGGTLMLNFSESNLADLAAGKPYIVKWSGGSDITDPLFWYVTFSSTASDATSEWVDFIGTTSPTVIYEDSEDKTKLYLGTDNTLYYPTREGFTVNSCRGYFCLKNELTAGEPRHTAVRSFLLRFVEDPLTEGSNFGDGSDDVTPINDQVKMKDDTDAVWFDLSGRRLATKPTHPGTYMNKGNKIIIK